MIALGAAPWHHRALADSNRRPGSEELTRTHRTQLHNATSRERRRTTGSFRDYDRAPDEISEGKEYPRYANADSAAIRISNAPRRPGIEREELARTNKRSTPRSGEKREGAKGEPLPPSSLAELRARSADRLVSCSCTSTRVHHTFSVHDPVRQPR
jgi:hypothetical protein